MADLSFLLMRRAVLNRTAANVCKYIFTLKSTPELCLRMQIDGELHHVQSNLAVELVAAVTLSTGCLAGFQTTSDCKDDDRNGISIRLPRAPWYREKITHIFDQKTSNAEWTESPNSPVCGSFRIPFASTTARFTGDCARFRICIAPGRELWQNRNSEQVEPLSTGNSKIHTGLIGVENAIVWSRILWKEYRRRLGRTCACVRGFATDRLYVLSRYFILQLKVNSWISSAIFVRRGKLCGDMNICLFSFFAFIKGAFRLYSLFICLKAEILVYKLTQNGTHVRMRCVKGDRSTGTLESRVLAE